MGYYTIPKLKMKYVFKDINTGVRESVFVCRENQGEQREIGEKREAISNSI